MKELDMDNTRTPQALGTENIRWDLSCFYAGINDPQINTDVELWIEKAQYFEKVFKGNLSTQLGNALDVFAELQELENKIFGYLSLLKTLDETDEAVKTKLDVCQRQIQIATGNYLTFFKHEITRLDEECIRVQTEHDETVEFHATWIADVRKQKPHLLSEEVEGALVKRSSSGPSSWSQFYDEVEADLQFKLNHKRFTQNEILHIANDDPDPKCRAQALKVFNRTLGKQFAKLSAQTLNMIVGAKQTEDSERTYPHPMSGRNADNKITDDAVEALHDAVLKHGAPLAQRYYKLKGRLIGIKPLAWSDRNAKIPFTSTTVISYPSAIQMVLEAYASFSPTLSEIIKEMIREKRIDAPAVPKKHSGAFNAPMILPNNTPACFTFLNYSGAERDVMTLAHELGHGVHGILAGNAQGVLMQSAPIALAETASIFGEMTTFNFLKRRAEAGGNKKALIALNVGKLSDVVNTVIRQISFSNFERRVHSIKNRLSVPELNNIWMHVTKELYGEDGEVFVYKDCEYLWSYIPHFHNPFYVYGYAFGELLTQSLYAVQSHFQKEEFERLYLDLLRAGNTKDPKELLAPFGLDPTRLEFWAEGFKTVEALLTETEQLSAAYGIV